MADSRRRYLILAAVVLIPGILLSACNRSDEQLPDLVTQPEIIEFGLGSREAFCLGKAEARLTRQDRDYLALHRGAIIDTFIDLEALRATIADEYVACFEGPDGRSGLDALPSYAYCDGRFSTVHAGDLSATDREESAQRCREGFDLPKSGFLDIAHRGGGG